MQTETIGFFNYQLYRLGWQQCLHQHLSAPQHWILSIFFYYRRGFVDASQWNQQFVNQP